MGVRTPVVLDTQATEHGEGPLSRIGANRSGATRGSKRADSGLLEDPAGATVVSVSGEPPAGDAVLGSFRGQNLEGADFSGKDLRGADFTGANLRSADFRNTSIGVAPRIGLVFLGASLLVAFAAGVAIGWGVDEIRDRFTADEWDQVAEGGTLGLTVLVLLGLIIWKGFDVAIRVIGVFYVVVVAINIVANLIWDEFEWIVLARATALIVFVVLAIVAGMLGRVVGGVFGVWSVVLVAALGGIATGQSEGGITGIIVAVSLAVISKRAVRGDPRDRRLRRVGHRLIRRWGTQFVDADLTGADFSGTDPSRCDARRASVDGVTWDPDHPLPVDVAEASARRDT